MTTPVGASPTGGLRGRAAALFDDAMALNLSNVEEALGRAPAGGTLADFGCDDGERTLRFAKAARAETVIGIDSVEERIALAVERGVDARVGDLSREVPLEDGSVDVVVSNQVIEHLADTD